MKQETIVTTFRNFLLISLCTMSLQFSYTYCYAQDTNTSDLCQIQNIVIPCDVFNNEQEQLIFPMIPGLVGYDVGINSGVAQSPTPLDDPNLTIERRQFVSPAFVPNLGAGGLSNPEELKLFPVDRVYRGQAAFNAWERTLLYGIVCFPSKEHEIPFVAVNPTTESCAYTRLIDDSDDRTSIEYCVFWRTNPIESPAACQVVAAISDEGLEVLAVIEGVLPGRGAGGEAFWFCVFPNTSVEYVATKIAELMSVLTEGSGVNMVNNLGDRYVVAAQASNLKNLHDDYFVRFSLMGDITSTSNASSSYAVTSGNTGFDPSEVQAVSGGVLFSYFRSYTVSPRMSDSIIDYREPSEITEEEVWQKYSEILESFYDQYFPERECQGFVI